VSDKVEKYAVNLPDGSQVIVDACNIKLIEDQDGTIPLMGDWFQREKVLYVLAGVGRNHYNLINVFAGSHWGESYFSSGGPAGPELAAKIRAGGFEYVTPDRRKDAFFAAAAHYEMIPF